MDVEAFLGSDYVQRQARWEAIRPWLVFTLSGAGSIVLVVYWWRNWLPRADAVSAQLTYAAVFQGTGALIGLAALAITFFWSQSANSKSALQSLAPKYAELAFTPSPAQGQKGGQQIPRVVALLDQMGEAIVKKTLSAGVALGTAGYFKSGDEVFVGLCRWAYTMSWYAGSPLPIPAFRAWIKRLGFDEGDVMKILAPSILERSHPDVLFEHQAALFNFANFAMSKLDQNPSGYLHAQIASEMLRDGVLVHLGRIKTFNQFKGMPFRVVLGIYAATMLASLLAMVSTGANWHSLPVLGGVIVGALVSIVATFMYVVELARHG